MKYGLIAEKVGHSFSAEIHKKLFGYDYELKAIKKEELDAFMREKDFLSVNVTIPYKEAVIPYLDYVNPIANDIGAVNTIVNNNGELRGYNTDALGLTAMILRSGAEIKDKKVLILGSGGTSKTALYVADKLLCREAYRVSRSEKDGCITYEEAYGKHNDADIIINTTPVGMFPDTEGTPIEISEFKKLSSVFDVVYNPLRTRLLCEARDRGIIAVGGLYMLVAQAAFAAERFVGKTVDNSRIDEIYREMLLQKENIVLIGMPRSGKSSTGKIIAEKSGRIFVDTDEEIIIKTGRHPSEIISAEGEEVFRDIEEDVIKEISLRQGLVIATGGGAILRGENIKRLKQNGRLYFLDRALDSLTVSEDRPLSSSYELLEKRYNERYPKYLAAADCVIKAVDGKELNANAVMEEMKYENSRA